jgi:phosphatidylserine/phosphatidylglycerophosphate/cardiolipin synthase-like enzyme
MKLQTRLISFLIGCMVLLTACSVFPTEASPTQQITIGNEADELIHLYFTSPADNSGCQLTVPVLQAIHEAQESIQIAMYNFNQEAVAEALVAAQARGVRVNIVMDNDKRENKVPSYLADSGIPMVYDPEESTMHNKFMIIDRKQVWTGSMNFTRSGCEDDYNHMIQIFSRELAANYQSEFDEMFVERSFSSASPANTPHPLINVAGVQIHTYFSPDDGVQAALLKLIARTQETIVFMAYSFTSDKLAEGLMDRAVQGVVVSGIMDADQIRSNTGGEYDRMRKAGISIAQDDISGQMHHKVLILDEKIVVLGSYNFSGNAEKRNDENVLILYSPAIARYFLQEYAQIKTR